MLTLGDLLEGTTRAGAGKLQPEYFCTVLELRRVLQVVTHTHWTPDTSPLEIYQ